MKNKRNVVLLLLLFVGVVVGGVVGYGALSGKDEEVPKYNKPPTNDTEVLDGKEEIEPVDEEPKEADKSKEDEEDLAAKEEEKEGKKDEKEETDKKSEDKKEEAPKKEDNTGDLSLKDLNGPTKPGAQEPNKQAPGTNQVESAKKEEAPSKQPSTNNKEDTSNNTNTGNTNTSTGNTNTNTGNTNTGNKPTEDNSSAGGNTNTNTGSNNETGNTKPGGSNTGGDVTIGTGEAGKEPVKPKPEDKVETKTETVENNIPFKTVNEKDPTLAKGQTKVKQQGVNGKEVVTLEVTYKNGKKVSSKEIKREVTV